MNRRQFAAMLAAAFTRSEIDLAIRASLSKHRIPSAVAMVASADKILYTGEFGAQVDSVFRIASMTKAVTTVAVLQLVERVKLPLDEPVEYPLEVLEGFDAND